MAFHALKISSELWIFALWEALGCPDQCDSCDPQDNHDDEESLLSHLPLFPKACLGIGEVALDGAHKISHALGSVLFLSVLLSALSGCVCLCLWACVCLCAQAYLGKDGWMTEEMSLKTHPERAELCGFFLEWQPSCSRSHTTTTHCTPTVGLEPTTTRLRALRSAD